MSRTDLDPATLAKSLRRMAGDGSVEWVAGPMQASVLLDIADILDENAKLRELVRKMYAVMDMADYVHEFDDPTHLMFVDDMRELGIEVDA